MGNHVVTGHAANYASDSAAAMGFQGPFKFESAASYIMKQHGIESWNAKGLVREALRRQAELAERSPLRRIQVNDGMKFMQKKFNEGVLASGLSVLGVEHLRIGRDQFAGACVDLAKKVKDYKGHAIILTSKDKEDFYSIFDSIDFDRSGTIGRGEWAGAVSVFFRGSTEECIKAVFDVLDRSGSKQLTAADLQEYLRPYVLAMIPEEASSLQPMLLKRATDTVFKQMDVNKNRAVTAEEMLAWTKAGHNVIDSLAELIDNETYALWLKNNKGNRRRGQVPQQQLQPGQSKSFDVSLPPMSPTMSPAMSSRSTEAAMSPSPQGTGSWFGAGSPGWSPQPASQVQQQRPAPFHEQHQGSTDHFHATAHHWAKVPPPPPPPSGKASTHFSHYGRPQGGRIGGC